MSRARVVVVAALAIAACQPAPHEGWDWGLPPGVPPPIVPADNPMSAERVELGRHLFWDTRLSGNETQACGSCHAQERGFTDGLLVSMGSTGDLTPRNAMSLTNVAYLPVLTWANPAITTLEVQAHGPMFGEDPVELGLSGREDELLARLRGDARYLAMFRDAFPGESDPISIDNIVRAIACFERTMLSFDSPYDRYVYRGDRAAMSESAVRGMELFFTERLECFHCHGGFNFTDSNTHAGMAVPEFGFHNNALYNIDGRGGYPEPNTGIYAHTGDRRDMGRFRAPTLRNIELTAPYMHDGSIATLEEVLDHYAAGGRTIESGPNAGVGSESPLKNIFLHGFELTPQEREDVLAFLRSLTDRTFAEDPRFASPFE